MFCKYGFSRLLFKTHFYLLFCFTERRLRLLKVKLWKSRLIDQLLERYAAFMVVGFLSTEYFSGVQTLIGLVCYS